MDIAFRNSKFLNKPTKPKTRYFIQEVKIEAIEYKVKGEKKLKLSRDFEKQ